MEGSSPNLIPTPAGLSDFGRSRAISDIPLLPPTILSQLLNPERAQTASESSDSSQQTYRSAPSSPYQSPWLGPRYGGHYYQKSPHYSAYTSPGLSSSGSPVFLVVASPVSTPGAGIVTEDDIRSLPIDEAHKGLALMHFHRLLHIASETDPLSIPLYTTKHEARKQLARMTLVIRDFARHHARNAWHKLEEEVCDYESVIQDIVDAAFHVDSTSGALTVPTLSNPLPPRREAEVRALVAEAFSPPSRRVASPPFRWRHAHQRHLPNDSHLPPDMLTEAEIDWDAFVGPATLPVGSPELMIEDRLVSLKGGFKRHAEALTERLAGWSKKLLGKQREERRSVVWPPIDGHGNAQDINVDWGNIDWNQVRGWDWKGERDAGWRGGSSSENERDGGDDDAIVRRSRSR